LKLRDDWHAHNKKLNSLAASNSYREGLTGCSEYFKEVYAGYFGEKFNSLFSRKYKKTKTLLEWIKPVYKEIKDNFPCMQLIWWIEDQMKPKYQFDYRTF
jgi:hypothetical protein